MKALKGVCPICRRDGADPKTGRHLDCNAAMAPAQCAEILLQWAAGRRAMELPKKVETLAQRDVRMFFFGTLAGATFAVVAVLLTIL